MKTELLIAAMFVLVTGCSGSADEDSGKADAGSSSKSAETGKTPAGNDASSTGPQGDKPEPKACTEAKECEGACPAESKGCTCADTPDNAKRCIPTCDSDKDCPSVEGMTLMCSEQKVCTPKQ